MISTGRIDCHVHYYPPAFADMLLAQQTTGGDALRNFVLGSKPAWSDLAALQQVMDDTDVSLGIIIPTAGLVERLGPAGPDATERYNQALSKELARSTGR